MIAVEGVRRRVGRDLHSVFVAGSHLFGCATPSSDLDLVAVAVGGARDLLLADGLDIVVHTVETFQDALDRQNVHTIACWSAPPAARLLDGGGFRYVVDRERLRVGARDVAEADWRKAERAFATDPDDARRRVVHGLRVLAFARQIAAHGRVVDFTEVNELREEILTAPAPDWAALERYR